MPIMPKIQQALNRKLNKKLNRDNFYLPTDQIPYYNRNVKCMGL
jgi:hypothetical protein